MNIRSVPRPRRPIPAGTENRAVPSAGEAADVWYVRSQPLWIVSGQAGMIAAIVLGFGAYPTKPKVIVLLMALSVASVVLFGPVGRAARIIVSLPVAAWIGWWLASYVWTYNFWGWYQETQQWVPVTLACIVIATLLPRDALVRALVLGCYAAIVYCLFKLGTSPGSATVNPDGVAGWRGSFGHKNGMAPFMVFAIAVITSFERNLRWKLGFVGVAIVLVVMSQSTTALAVALMLVPVSWLYNKMATSDAESSRIVLLLWSIGVTAVGVLSVSLMPMLLEARGKDATLSKRTEVWGGVWPTIMERRWTGYGIGGVWRDQGAEPTLTINRDLGFIVFHSHNGYLEILLQVGAIGLAVYAGLLVLFVINGFRLLRIDPALGRFMTLLALIILLTSVTEVATLGMWAVLLCAIHSAALPLRTPTLERR